MRSAPFRRPVLSSREHSCSLQPTLHKVPIEPEFSNTAGGWEKGQVEKNVWDFRHQILHRMPASPTLMW